MHFINTGGHKLGLGGIIELLPRTLQIPLGFKESIKQCPCSIIYHFGLLFSE